MSVHVRKQGTITIHPKHTALVARYVEVCAPRKRHGSPGGRSSIVSHSISRTFINQHFVRLLNSPRQIWCQASAYPCARKQWIAYKTRLNVLTRGRRRLVKAGTPSSKQRTPYKVDKPALMFQLKSFPPSSTHNQYLSMACKPLTP